MASLLSADMIKTIAETSRAKSSFGLVPEPSIETGIRVEKCQSFSGANA